MQIDIVSIFPEMFAGLTTSGVIGRACASGALVVRTHDLRLFAQLPHRRVDDSPYGGGAGMVYQVEPLQRATAALARSGERVAVVLPTPAGQVFDQALARELQTYEQMIVLCDRYEGSDARARRLATHEISLGDFVVTGAEPIAAVIVDAVARLVPGVVGAEESVEHDSFSAGLLEHGHYTRPREFQGERVPDVLLSGNHGWIAEWRRRDGIRRTLERRPDLLGATLADADRDAIETERRYS